MKLIKIINQIEAISSGAPGTCQQCPNFKNKPEDQGCGLEVCLDQINGLIRQVQESKIVPRLINHLHESAGAQPDHHDSGYLPDDEWYDEHFSLRQHFMVSKD